jgi:hypothetical protein
VKARLSLEREPVAMWGYVLSGFAAGVMLPFQLGINA